MLKEQDLLDYDFKVIKAKDYNAGTDMYQKPYVVAISEYEKKKISIVTHNYTDLEFCYFINIFPRRGYDFKHGLKIRKSGVPHIWGETVFDGMINNKEELGKLLEQICE